jgi:hypothetical protein
MPSRSPILRFIVCLTPRSIASDLERAKQRLDDVTGPYRYASIEGDGTIEVGVNARHIDEAETHVERDLGDDLAPQFIIGHPPL